MSSVVIPKLFQVSVAAGGTAQKMFSGTDPKASNLLITAPSTNTTSIFLGDSTLTATNGFEIPKGTSLQINQQALVGMSAMYFISATTGDKLNILSLEQN